MKRENVYKVLTFGDIFVDERLLHKGIYEANTPKLHDLSITKEKYIEILKSNFSILNYSKDQKTDWLNNLEVCEFKDIVLSFS
jgi:hypothetical protein